MFAVKATYHTTLQTTPAQLVFGRDAILKVKVGSKPYSGPYQILKLNSNGTVHLQKGIVEETVNLRLIKPFQEE